MAYPIEPTETLTGKDAKAFLKAIENQEPDPVVKALVEKAKSLPKD